MMKQKIKSVLLIDDNPSDNYLHRRVLMETDICDQVAAVEDGYEALEYLHNNPAPELIFLDINMPGMDGWEFLEEYKKLESAKRSGVVVVMLTTSLNYDDKEKAENIASIENFINKPLTEEIVMDIVKEYFPDRLSGF